MYFKHELIVMQLSLANVVPESIVEMIHDEGLATARITPEINAFQFLEFLVFRLSNQFFLESQWICVFLWFGGLRSRRCLPGKTPKE